MIPHVLLPSLSPLRESPRTIFFAVSKLFLYHHKSFWTQKSLSTKKINSPQKIFVSAFTVKKTSKVQQVASGGCTLVLCTTAAAAALSLSFQNEKVSSNGLSTIFFLGGKYESDLNASTYLRETLSKHGAIAVKRHTFVYNLMVLPKKTP